MCHKLFWAFGIKIRYIQTKLLNNPGENIDSPEKFRIYEVIVIGGVYKTEFDYRESFYGL